MTTVANIITQVRQRIDMVNSTFVTDAELVGWISNALGELDDILVATYERYKVTLSATATISSPTDGTNYFALPADFLKALRVDRYNAGTWSRIDPISLLENPPPTELLPSLVEPLGYIVMGSNCWIEPWSSAGGSYRVWYVPRFTVLTSTSDNLASYMDVQGWHEYAIVDACMKVVMKQDMDASQWMALKAAARQRVVEAAKPRDAGAPKRMVNTRERRPGWDSW